MTKTILIFGTHPIRESLVRQYEASGARVACSDAYALAGEVPDEVVILPTGREDAPAEAFLAELAKAVKGGHRPLVHLLLNESVTLRKYMVSDFPPEVNAALEVYPFTLEEAWAETVLQSGLDREPIGPESRQFAHLVIAGFDVFAQSLALYAAQTAHFPNYNGGNPQPLRTRITLVGLQPKERDRFISRYHHLFDHSFYRLIDLEKQQAVLHHPEYEGRRKDFVDVEWEFVEGDVSHPVLQEKLKNWAQDDSRQLTLAVSTPDDNENLDIALGFPDCVAERGIPVWVRQGRDGLSAALGQNPRYSHYRPFGMEDGGYDVHLPAIRLAKYLHYFYTCSPDLPTFFPREAVDAAWKEAGTLKMRLSNVWSVRCFAVKMRSVGHSADEYYALSLDEQEALARVEHNRWCVERLLSGTRVCTDEELAAIRKDIGLKKQYKKERDAHRDLCSYDELGVDERGVDVRQYDRDLTACIPLIMKSFYEEAGR